MHDSSAKEKKGPGPGGPGPFRVNLIVTVLLAALGLFGFQIVESLGGVGPDVVAELGVQIALVGQDFGDSG
jgi:hypothetical protein